MTARPDREIAARVDWGSSGLVPAIVQDPSDGRVLMLGYMDPEALAATLETGDIHFHSRARDRLWKKGETSGNFLRVRRIEIDCDGDALLVQADPAGPTCHLGKRSCFDREAETAASSRPQAAARPSPEAAQLQGFAWLETLWATIDSRVGADPASSYTARLIAAGVDGPSRKVAEEATEVLMAAKDDATAGPDRRAQTRDALTGEVADLLYHTLVLLRERGLDPADVIACLRQRHKA
jgi:phosphoribosyl-ATP pyrophosphohydrolase/phosphoribosyl-AMP cyclohydrolase